MRTYKVLSALLDDPTDALVRAGPEMRAVLEEERLVSGSVLRSLQRLIGVLETDDLAQQQAHYAAQFRREPAFSLYLFEHVHADPAARERALSDLATLYARLGYAVDTTEPADYLPLFLEFLASLEPAEARSLLSEVGEVLESLGGRLARARSPYAAVFEALLELSGARHLPGAEAGEGEEDAENERGTPDAGRDPPLQSLVMDCAGESSQPRA